MKVYTTNHFQDHQLVLLTKRAVRGIMVYRPEFHVNTKVCCCLVSLLDQAYVLFRDRLLAFFLMNGLGTF